VPAHLVTSIRLRLAQTWGWAALSVTAALLVVMPIAALSVVAVTGGATEVPSQWSHLLAYVLPQAVTDTVVLLFGVACIVVMIGTVAAWLVSAYDFPGRGVLDWLLLLPLAMPSYVIAYAYLDLLHPLGPVSSVIRSFLDIDDPAAFRLPDIRSTGGCILLLGLVLYPYVYLTARALFLMQAANLTEAARMLGSGPAGVFFRVALPLARPAIAVGLSLALMEALNDIGASEFLGVRTMTVAVYTTWITRSDLAGAAQIALCTLFFVMMLVVLERASRRRLGYAQAAQRPRRMRAQQLRGPRAWLALAAVLVPVLLGFALPALHLAMAATERIGDTGIPATLVQATLNTVSLSAVAALIAVAVGLGVAYFARLVPPSGGIARTVGIGYAVPGTVLAIGLLAPIAAADLFIHDAARSLFGMTTGLVVIGSGAALIYAYVVRFLAVSTGAVESGFHKLSPSLDYAARTLGENPSGVLRRVHLPLLRPALGAAAILVFVDCMKELPATLLLRPLNFETLATMLYGEAARGTYEDGAIAALVIVLAGVIPVIILARASRL
jgi:iron(III) transport system permease protein